MLGLVDKALGITAAHCFPKVGTSWAPCTGNIKIHWAHSNGNTLAAAKDPVGCLSYRVILEHEGNPTDVALIRFSNDSAPQKRHIDLENGNGKVLTDTGELWILSPQASSPESWLINALRGDAIGSIGPSFGHTITAVAGASGSPVFAVPKGTTHSASDGAAALVTESVMVGMHLGSARGIGRAIGREVLQEIVAESGTQEGPLP
jgi:hypothetical protein